MWPTVALLECQRRHQVVTRTSPVQRYCVDSWLFPLGYLVCKSKSLPRFLGVLVVPGGIGVMIWFLQAPLLPDYRAIIYPGLAVSFIAELGLA